MKQTVPTARVPLEGAAATSAAESDEGASRKLQWKLQGSRIPTLGEAHQCAVLLWA